MDKTVDKIDYGSGEKKRANVFARIILERKLPVPLQAALFYVCLCFGNWYGTRGALAQIANSMSMRTGLMNFLCNDVTAFVTAGIFPLLIYFLATRLTFRIMNAPYTPSVRDQGYALRAFYGLGYLVYGAFSMIYFAAPYISLYGETIFCFLIMAAAVAGYILFECYYRLRKFDRFRAVYAYGSVFGLIFMFYYSVKLIALIGGWA